MSGIVNPLTPELNPSAQWCLMRFFTGEQRSWDFINITGSSTCNMLFIFLFILILQYSLSCIGPYIFLTIFLSNILSVFASPSHCPSFWPTGQNVSVHSTIFQTWLTHPAWWWKQQYSLKCWQTTIRLYRIMTQNTAVYIVTAISLSFTNSLSLYVM
jgi:hypothetical protein